MADRVLVVCEGRITADIAREDATPEAVMRAATNAATDACEDAPAYPEAQASSDTMEAAR
jgi:rhamnose transport system ATP-binding protein